LLVFQESQQGAHGVAREAPRNALRKEWFMRRFRRLYFAGGLTLVMALAFAGISSASHGVQPADVFFTKTGKSTPKGDVGTLDVRLGPAIDDPATPDPVPPKPTNVYVDLSQGITVEGSKFPTCDPAVLEGVPPTGPGSAQSLCGNEAPKSQNALIATGDAKAQVGSTVLDANALAFNGAGGAVIVYARVEAISTTTIVPCQLGTAPDQTKFKTRFTCNVPPLAGGAGALTQFNLKFDRVAKKVKKKHGKKKKKFFSIVYGKCPASGAFDFAVTWDYSDHPSETREISHPC